MLNTIAILILVLVLVQMPLFLTVSAKLDILKNDGYLKLSFFNIPIFNSKLEFFKDTPEKTLRIKNKKRHHDLHMAYNNKDKKSIAVTLAMPVIKIIKIRSVYFQANIGKADNPLFTTYTISSLKISYSILISMLKSRQSFYNYSEFIPFYGNDMFNCEFHSILSISFADIIYSIFIGFYKIFTKKRIIKTKIRARS